MTRSPQVLSAWRAADAIKELLREANGLAPGAERWEGCVDAARTKLTELNEAFRGMGRP
jgi:hypothetical protein